MNRNLFLRLQAQKNIEILNNENGEKKSYIRSYDEIYKDIDKYTKLKVAIIDVCNQDIGIKILFPEADYYIFEKRPKNEIICEQYKINLLENIQNINDNTYDSLFVIVSMYNAIQYISEGKQNHEYLENITNYFSKIVDIINNNNFKNVFMFLNCDLNYDPNIIFNHYKFTDEKPFNNSYYRLRQVDKDGKESFSKIIVVKMLNATELSLMSLYPNPAKNIVNLVISGNVDEKVTLVVTDFAGKIVKTQNAVLSNSSNIITLDIATLNSGNYLLKVIGKEGTNSAFGKFFKQ
jgi:hypothetical protein